jgi:mannosylglucosylglycerate synthase
MRYEMGKKIGFVSTRFAGTDGVTMESSKWAAVLRTMGHECYWFAGELDRAPQRSYLVPEAHFHYEKNKWINQRIFGTKGRKSSTTETIHALKSMLKVQIHEFIDQFGIELLIVQNALTIPLHVPLGIAITEFLAETQFPTIAHHHDFYWERTRFSINGVGDYLRMAFPPHLPNIEHVVINSSAQEELALRTGISSHVVPNVLDFEMPPQVNPERSDRFRKMIGLASDDIIILQPTRVIQRKGIEHAIDLVERLEDGRCKLVVSHEAGDEGFDYADWIKEAAAKKGVDLLLVETRVKDPLNDHQGDDDLCSLWDIYHHANFITYPSLYEGFGNAFLEAVYFKKPLLINRYSIFIRDIEPKGFDLVVMDGFVSSKIVAQVREIMNRPERCRQMVEKNMPLRRGIFLMMFCVVDWATCWPSFSAHQTI